MAKNRTSIIQEPIVPTMEEVILDLIAKNLTVDTCCSYDMDGHYVEVTLYLGEKKISSSRNYTR